MAEEAVGRGGVGGRRFHIHSCLGRGGFGEVYRATMSSSGGVRTEVAVKILREDIDPGSEAVKRLRDEGRLLGALRHPAILRVHDLVLLEGRVALVTEYVEGEDLDQCMSADPPMPLRALIGVVGEVAAALHAAWTSPAPDGDEPVHLVHRDVKPANIRIGKHGEVKLLDFGIARATNVAREAQTANNAMMGSYLYMAPERFHEDSVFPPSDIYALGCVLFEGLTGHRLFEGKTLKQIYGTMLSSKKFRKHLDARFELLPEELPEEVVEILRAMLHPDSEQRPGATDVARQCEDLVEDLSGPTLKRWARRRTWPSPRNETGWLEGRDLSAHSFGSAEHMPRSAEDTWVHDTGPPPEVEAAPEVVPPSRSQGVLPPLNLMALPSPGGQTALDAPMPRLATDEVARSALADVASTADPEPVEEPEPEPEPEPVAPVVSRSESPVHDDAHDLPGVDELVSALADEPVPTPVVADTPVVDEPVQAEPSGSVDEPQATFEPEPLPRVDLELERDFFESQRQPGPTAVPMPDRSPTYTPPMSPVAQPPPSPVAAPPPISDQPTGPPALDRARTPSFGSAASAVHEAGYIPIDDKRTPEPIPGVMEDMPPPPIYVSGDDFVEVHQLHARQRNRRLAMGGLLGLVLLIAGGVVGWAIVDGEGFQALAGGLPDLGTQLAPEEGLRPAGLDVPEEGEGAGSGDPETPEPVSAAAAAPVAPSPKPVAQPEPKPKPKPTSKPRPRPKPSGASALRSAGWSKVESDPEAAVDLFKRSLDVEPNHPDGHYGHGYALLQLGRNGEAATSLCRAVTTGDTEIKRDVGSLIRVNGLSCD